MTTESKPESTTLYYRQGGSDKVYKAAVEASGSGFVVNFAYGRRGSTLQTGTKTAAPVDYAAAKKIFDKLLQEKTAKGYTPGEDGTPYQQTDREARSTGILPQLLNAIEEAQVEPLLADPHWWAQEKFDGKRLLIRKAGDEVSGINRSGLIVALPQPIAQNALQLGGGQWLMDGEALGDSFVAFDLLESACVDLRQEPYRGRLKALFEIVTANPALPISAVETAMGTTAKTSLLNRLTKNKAEGIVFKDVDAPYAAGRPSSGGPALKFKFVATASCIVSGTSRAKRSVALELIDGSGRVGVGNVTIPPRTPLPAAGQIVEVRYLHAYSGGSLYQPVYLGLRHDIAADACVLSQLKFKRDGDEDA